MGELHLEIIVDRLKREFKVESNVGKPEVAYREAITQEGRSASTSTRSSPAATASTATCCIEIEPGERGTGFVFENDIVGGIIPKEFIPAIEKGIREAHGARRARRLPGHRRARRASTTAATTRSTRRAPAFEVAASLAFQDGAKRAGLHLLEPIMTVEVVVPEQYMGDVIGDLNSRRGTHPRHEPARQRAGHRRRGPARDDVRLRRPTCAARRRVARPTRCSSRTTRRSRPRSRKRSSPRSRAASSQHYAIRDSSGETRHGQREIRTEPSRT